MKIVFNTHQSNDSSYVFYKEGLSALEYVRFDDWDNYENYDIVLFMAFSSDLPEVLNAKSKNPRIKVGLVDPRGVFINAFLSHVDFLIVDSIEMKDFFAYTGKPILFYQEYPPIKLKTKVHVAKEKIVIGYHGNKVHLSSMFPKVTKALEALSKKYDIELWAVYNVKALGKWKVGRPKGVKIKDIQWHEGVYEELSRVDIGLCPNLMLLRSPNLLKALGSVSPYFLERKEDYLVRFKMPSNAGRIIIFGILGVPVVTDFLPSALQLVRDEHNGLIACSNEGWYYALERLITSHELREKFAAALQKEVQCRFGKEMQNASFEEFCRKVSTDQRQKESPILTVKTSDWFVFYINLALEFIEKIRNKIFR